jgi:homocitrate synthase NifV
MGKIYIIDVTNRDGVQTARLGLSKIEKTMLNLYLNEMGVFQSEFGFPTTRHEVNYLNANIALANMGFSLQSGFRAGSEPSPVTLKQPLNGSRN